MIKKILLGVLALLVLVVVFVGIYLWQFDPDNYRADLELQIQQATGFDAEITGGLSMLTQPDLQLEAKQLQLTSQGRNYLKLDNLRMTVAWRPFLQRELQVKAIQLDNAVLNLWQDEEGNLILPAPPVSPEPSEPPPAAAAALPLNRVIVDNISIDNLQFTMQQLGETPTTVVAMTDVAFELQNLLIAENAQLLIDQWPNYLNQVALNSRLDIGQIEAGSHTLDAIQLSAANNGSLIDVDLGMKAYGGTVAAESAVNWLSDNLSLDTDVTVQTVRLSQLLQAFQLKQKGEGLLKLNLDAATQFAPEAVQDWLANLSGNLLLEGDGLVVEGLNVDRLVNSLLKSQEMTLTDIGGFALAGPLALLVTKGGNYTAALQGALAGETQIPALRTELAIQDQKVNFDDVAFSTDSNRLAVSGHLDLAEQSFGPIAIQILNETGCQLFKTNIKGKLDSPEIAAAEMAAASVLNPLLSLAKKGTNLVSECKPVYQGKIAHPENVQAPQAPQLQEH